MPGMRALVCSRSLSPRAHPDVTIVADGARETLAALRAEPGKDIWLFGGGVLFRSLLGMGLVDSVEVAVVPVLLGGGIPLLPPPAAATKLRLTRHRVYPTSGIVEPRVRGDMTLKAAGFLVIGVAILAVLAVRLGRARWQDGAAALCARLEAARTDAEPRTFSPLELDGLPAPRPVTGAVESRGSRTNSHSSRRPQPAGGPARASGPWPRASRPDLE